MAKIITLGNQKGGVGKSTTTALVAYEMAKRGYRVLVADTDGQGNSTETLTMQPSKEFMGRSIAEALEDENAKPYIINIRENLDLLPGCEDMSAFSRYILTTFTKKTPEGHIMVNEKGQVMVHPSSNLVIRRTLDKIKDAYDFILLDTPPALSEATINALAAADYVCILFKTAKFSYDAIETFMDTIHRVQERIQPNLKILGMVATLVDRRRFDFYEFVELLEETYPDLVFKTAIPNYADIERIPAFGYPEKMTSWLEPYAELVDEIIERINKEEATDVQK
jgi:chromosome partitioning protein